MGSLGDQWSLWMWIDTSEGFSNSWSSEYFLGFSIINILPVSEIQRRNSSIVILQKERPSYWSREDPIWLCFRWERLRLPRAKSPGSVNLILRIRNSLNLKTIRTNSFMFAKFYVGHELYAGNLCRTRTWTNSMMFAKKSLKFISSFCGLTFFHLL